MPQLADNQASQQVNKRYGNYGDRVLIQIASLSSFDPKYEAVSGNALTTLLSKYGSTVDNGVIAALNHGSDDQKEAQPENQIVESVVDGFSIDNYPNPYNPSTTISYALPEGVNVTLTVYDNIGREVNVLVNEFQQRGIHTVTFNGSTLSSGVYYYKITARKFSAIKKMILVK